MGRPGLKIRAGDGGGELGFPEMLSTPLFYRAHIGARLTLLDAAYKFNVATYRPEVDPRWLYTYDYAPEQNWTSYRGDLNGESYRQADYLFNESIYFRVCLRKVDGGLFGPAEDINDSLVFEADEQPAEPAKPWLVAEARQVAQKVRAIRQPGEFAFALMADTHYTVGGTWEDTRAAVKLVNEEVGLDGIIHLGDLTDGMVMGEVTRHYVKNMLTCLKASGLPVWVALGNHDSNYFRNNPERLSEEEQCEIYLDGKRARYYVDLPRLRLIFLDSFEPDEELRYGYSQECALWLAEALENLPEGGTALILSHLPPLTRLQYWAKALRGEKEIMGVLKRSADKILAWVNGHNHADRLDNDEGFPIVSIANAKCEAFTEHKTEGFVTQERRLGEASQELWDVMLVNIEERRANFIRFGSGGDRLISNGKARWG